MPGKALSSAALAEIDNTVTNHKPMKIGTFNANGIRAASRKVRLVMTQDIDVLCIQETKAQLDNVTGIPGLMSIINLC